VLVLWLAVGEAEKVLAMQSVPFGVTASSLVKLTSFSDKARYCDAKQVLSPDVLRRSH
jgi:hypothetical protein